MSNVLLITIDTCRADRIGCYGYGLARTQAIDALASEGVRCTNAITTAPITMPAHTSIMTGLFPPAHGVRDNGAYALNDDAITLAERLKEAGYDTHAIVSALVLNRRYNLTQGFDGYDDDLSGEDNPKMFMIRDRPAQKSAAKAVAWLESWQSKQEGNPFFMWVHFFDPHHPHEARVPDRYLIPTAYDAEIAQADDGVEIITNWLRQQQLIDDTLIVVTADHGESIGEHNEKTHAIFVYDATVRVPLIWRHPNLVPQGEVYEGPVRAVDLMPTILAALDLPGGESTQGTNLLPALQGKIEPLELPQYSESLLAEVGFGMAPLYSVRMDGHKFIRAPRPELYDLRLDPKELSNIHDDYPEIVARLESELDRILEDSRTMALDTTENPMDEETIEMLEALGYLADAADRNALGGMDPKDGIHIYRKLEQGRHLAQRGQWAESESVLRELVEELPGHISARNTLAMTLRKQDKLAEAEEEYARSLAQDPRQNRILYQMAKIRLAHDDIEKAGEFLRNVLTSPHVL